MEIILSYYVTLSFLIILVSQFTREILEFNYTTLSHHICCHIMLHFISYYFAVILCHIFISYYFAIARLVRVSLYYIVTSYL